jgi:hypothetical protein
MEGKQVLSGIGAFYPLLCPVLVSLRVTEEEHENMGRNECHSC